MKRITYLTFLVCFALSVNAQTRTIFGYVYTGYNKPVRDVTVKIPDNSVIVKTDIKGDFKITIPESEQYLTFFKNGFKADTIPLRRRNYYIIKLEVSNISDLEIEDLDKVQVNSASFFGVHPNFTPGYVYSLDMKKIERESSRTLSDIVLMKLPGFSDGSQQTVGKMMGVRGMKLVINSKTLVMLDGQPLNQRQNLGYWQGMNSILMGDLKELEVSLSPNALVHGSGAMNGYINFIPKNGNDEQGLYLTTERGTTESLQKIDLGYGFNFGERKNLYLYAGWYNARGFVPDSFNMPNKLYRHSIDNQYSYYAYSTYQPCYRLAGYLNYKNFNLNVGFQQLWDVPSTHQFRRNFQNMLTIRPKYVFPLSDKTSFEALANIELIDLGVKMTNYDGVWGTQATYGGGEGHWETKFLFKTRRFNHHSVAAGGLLGQRYFRTEKTFFGPDLDLRKMTHLYNPKLYIWHWESDSGAWNEAAVYVEDIWEINKSLIITGGLRFDYVDVKDLSQKKKHLSPRLSVVYSPSQNSVFRLSYLHGFRTPDCHVYYAAVNLRIPYLNQFNPENNPDHNKYMLDLQPESMESFELNYHHGILDNRLNLDVNLYYNIHKNSIDYITYAIWDVTKSQVQIYYPGRYFTDEAISNWAKGAYQTYNVYNQAGSYNNFHIPTRFAGMEIISDAKIGRTTELNLYYGYNYLFTDEFKPKMIFPNHQMKLSLTQYFADNDLSVNAGFLFEPALEDNEANRKIFHDIYFHPRTVLDITTYYRVNQYLAIRMIAKNITKEITPPMNDMPKATVEQVYLGANQPFFYFSLLFNIRNNHIDK